MRRHDPAHLHLGEPALNGPGNRAVSGHVRQPHPDPGGTLPEGRVLDLVSHHENRPFKPADQAINFAEQPPGHAGDHDPPDRGSTVLPEGVIPGASTASPPSSSRGSPPRLRSALRHRGARRSAPQRARTGGQLPASGGGRHIGGPSASRRSSPPACSSPTVGAATWRRCCSGCCRARVSSTPWRSGAPPSGRTASRRPTTARPGDRGRDNGPPRVIPGTWTGRGRRRRRALRRDRGALPPASPRVGRRPAGDVRSTPGARSRHQLSRRRSPTAHARRLGERLLLPAAVRRTPFTGLSAPSGSLFRLPGSAGTERAASNVRAATVMDVRAYRYRETGTPRTG